MCKSCVGLVRTALPLLALWPAAAAEGGSPLVLVVDSRRFTGWQAWWANIYNDNRWYFALITVIVIPLLGVVMGKLTGLVMSRLGINLKSRVVAEH
jgi:hypothetical protein